MCELTSRCKTEQRSQVWRRVESGSADGGSFGDIMHIPFLVAVLLFGVIVALVGFWRVGASYATQQSAQIGSVNSSGAAAPLSGLWLAWSNNNYAPGQFNPDDADHSVSANINSAASYDNNILGEREFGVGAQSYSRIERFYPGQPGCEEEDCGN